MTRLAELINKLISPLGVKLSRVRRRVLPVLRPGIVQAKVGSATLAMPADSTIPFEYAVNPDYGSQIGRLAGYLKETTGEYLAIDVGANVGDTLAIIRQAADVPVMCVEGDPKCAALFRENSRIYDRVELVDTFLSESEGNENVTVQKDGWNATLIPEAGGAPMSFRTLDSVASGRSLPCGLLKLDVEGYEWKILRGARELLTKDQPVICIEYNIRHSGFPPEEFVRGMEGLRDLGYDQVIVYESQGALLSTFSLSDGWEDYLDLHHFLRLGLSPVLYVDLTIFPSSKGKLGGDFAAKERLRIRNAAK
ncbi:FkbM family methyltransferase [Luteolibacter arcticus]|uniref:FkbM family methyltransferase n=1 Tax=Luteolibacter arcticus TaxID=1581411 RepID=A0ABT3GJ66_9BACT|nr:FkbM family methyltransferase [Luteolibacter arcticus]MCW1923526.1 FkbM family methyltransferase [Luteolibacter arcticus]